MREAIGGTWIFGIVVTFIVLFSSYLAISVNYSKAFRVKNEIVSLIEKYEGHNDTSAEKIEDYLNSVGYGIYSNCPTGTKGEIVKNGKFKYCWQRIDDNTSSIVSLNRAYYNVRVFFKLDLPVIGNLFTFPVTGETKPVYSSK